MSFIRQKPQYSTLEIVHAIRTSAKDPNVKAVMANIRPNSMGMSQIQDVREAIKTFRVKGLKYNKLSYCYGQSYGEGENGTLYYYLASAFDQIWLQPIGMVSFTGLSFETPFTKRFFNHIGVKPELIQHKEYKNFANTYMEEDFTPAHKTSLTHLCTTLSKHILQDVALSREITLTEVKDAMDNSPLLDHEAKTRGLIDVVGHKDAFKQKIRETYGDDVIFISPRHYIQKFQKASKAKNPAKIRIIYGGGMIMDENTPSLVGNKVLSATMTVKQLNNAAEDEDVKAIILHVNSGGGSAVASEKIARAISNAKKKKPVIVSLSDYGASGAYWLAASASKIVSQPGTITGSIGVIMGKFNAETLTEAIGVHWGRVSVGKNADIWSLTKSLSPESKNKLYELSAHLYDGFVQRVSEGRNLPIEHVREIAKGRAWTGEDALKYGLVDRLGGISVAIKLAIEEAKLKDMDYSIDYDTPDITFPDIFKSIFRGGTASFLDFSSLKQLMTYAMKQPTYH